MFEGVLEGANAFTLQDLHDTEHVKGKLAELDLVLVVANQDGLLQANLALQARRWQLEPIGWPWCILPPIRDRKGAVNLSSSIP